MTVVFCPEKITFVAQMSERDYLEIAKKVARFHKTCISTQRQQFSTSDAQCQILHLIILEEIYLDFFCYSTTYIILEM